MDPFEKRLKSLALLRPSAEFGKPETLAKEMDRRAVRYTFIERIHNMSWKAKAASMVALAGSIAVAYLALTVLTSGSVAFAQVAEKLQSARTLSYDWEIRQESDGKVLSKGRNQCMVPGKLRIEYDGPSAEHSYAVIDTAAGKVLFVDEKQKSAHLSPIAAGEKQDMAAETIEEVRSLKSNEARPIGEKKFDGIQAKGYQVDGKRDTKTVWADVVTGNPVRVEIRQQDPRSGPTLTVWTNIKLDQPLDAKRFSVEPPAGFSTTPSLAINTTGTPANFVADFLKIYSKHMNGQFPKRLQDAVKELGEKLAPANATPPKVPEAPSGEMMQVAFYGAAMAAVTNRSPRGERWQYYPDCKFGDANGIVFWFYDKKKDAYHAVYGDLHVKPVKKGDLPASP
jgi:outer membrane lipoprotein-sorting protein